MPRLDIRNRTVGLLWRVLGDGAKTAWSRQSPLVQRAVPPLLIAAVVLLLSWALWVTPDLALIVLLAITYALYILLAEHALSGRDAVSLLAWGFGFAALFWAVIAPWWSFPAQLVAADTSLLGHVADRHLPVWALMAWMIVLGTIVPFFLLVSALRHLPATRVGIIAMVEPVVATIVAWAWLGESLAAEQLAGAAVVLCAIVLAQTAR